MTRWYKTTLVADYTRDVVVIRPASTWPERDFVLIYDRVTTTSADVEKWARFYGPGASAHSATVTKFSNVATPDPYTGKVEPGHGVLFLTGLLPTDATRELIGGPGWEWVNDLGLRPMYRNIVTVTATNPAVVTVDEPHQRTTGQKVRIVQHAGSTPVINGDHTVTVIDETSFSIPVHVTAAGTGGRAVSPNDYKDYEADMESLAEAGIGLMGDRRYTLKSAKLQAAEEFLHVAQTGDANVGGHATPVGVTAGLVGLTRYVSIPACDDHVKTAVVFGNADPGGHARVIKIGIAGGDARVPDAIIYGANPAVRMTVT
jgi:hypothetical protein